MSDVSISAESVQAISDWLLSQALADDQAELLFDAFCERLAAAGLPLIRGHFAIRALHPLIASVTHTWRLGSGVEIVRLPYEVDDTPEWRLSPLAFMLERREFMARYRLDRPGPWSGFPLLADLQRDGATDYLAMLSPFGDPETAFERRDGIVCSWLTDRPGGFRELEIEAIRRLQLRLAVAAKVIKRERTAVSLAAAYLGVDAGRRVLEGQIRRGDSDVILAVLWYSDMRGSTTLTETLPRGDFLAMLDRYFECTAGAVLNNGGQVLRFIGDAVFGVFPLRDPADASAAVRRAVAAARDAADLSAAVNVEREARGEPAIRYGLGLHIGEVLYGNIGVPERLEFSVIGRAANEVARLEGLTKDVGEPVIASAAFAGHVKADWRPCGRHLLRGTTSEMEIFALPARALPEAGEG